MMRSLLLLALCVCTALGAPSTPPLAKRDNAPIDSPSGTYAPLRVDCPANLAVRLPPTPQGALNTEEAAYIARRQTASLPAWRTYLANVALDDFDIDAFLAGGVPVTGAAVSGGGLRAMLHGGTVLNGLDARNEEAVEARTGGVLQVLTYLSGLSGGGWMTGSWALANAPTFTNLNEEIWNLEEALIAPEAEQPTVYADAVASTALKGLAGYPISVVDVYGRFLSYHLIGAPQGTLPGAGTLWNAIRDTTAYQQAQLPFPIVVSTARLPGETTIRLDSVTYEHGPIEFGTRHPTLSAFISTDYLGSSLINGSPAPGMQCTVGFDNAGFVLGTTSNIFGATFDDNGIAPMSPLLQSPAVQALLGAVPDQVVTAGRYPSPFQGLNAATYAESAQSELELVDGGFNGENVPFHPLILPERKVDVVIALDASADTEGNYPDGSAPFLTYTKTQLPGFGFTPFPAIPPPEDFVAAGLNARPSFFGCDDATPLIVYLPNYAKARSNTGTSTLQLQYSDEQTADFFANGFAIATQPDDATWPSCLACALIDRQVTRNGQARTAQCQTCFDRFCYSSTPTPGPSQRAVGSKRRAKREMRAKKEAERVLV